jgi:hypothetical protein
VSRTPDLAGGVQQVGRTHHVGVYKRKRIGDGTVHVRLGCQVDDVIEAVLGKQIVDKITIYDVAPQKSIVLRLLNVGKVSKVTGVG